MKGKVYFYGFFGPGLIALLLVLGASQSHAKGQDSVSGKTNSIQGKAVSYSVTSTGDPADYSCAAQIKGKKSRRSGGPLVKVPRDDSNKGSLCDALKSAYTHGLSITIHFTGSQKDRTIIPNRIDYPHQK